jgi:hypothetical protein
MNGDKWKKISFIYHLILDKMSRTRMRGLGGEQNSRKEMLFIEKLSNLGGK